MGKILVNGQTYGGGGSGGGGNVDDVYVNGESVLDADKVAQIKSYKEVTQAEYDALPASKLTDGILYCITDDFLDEGNKFVPVIYSTEEREIGVWIDGRPLYQKVITFSPMSNSPSKRWYNVADVSSLSINHLVTCVLYNGNYRPWYEYYAEVQDGYLKIYSANDSWGANAALIQYTKITDTPGSGKWTSTGVPAVHYSTEEHIIGTWVDGKPLYEKTFAYNISPVNDWTLFDDSVSYDLLIDARGYHKNSVPEVFPLVASEASNPRWSVQSDHKVYYYITSNITRSGYITLQYTKTTD